MDVESAKIIISDKPPEIYAEIDLVLFSNVLLNMVNPASYIDWARRATYIVVAEWKKAETPQGPSTDERIGVEKLRKMCSGFELIKLEEFLPYHYMSVSRRA